MRGCRPLGGAGTRCPTGLGRGGGRRRNLGYWDGGQWWGAGPGAHGYVGATRCCTVKHPNTYAEMLAGATLSVAGFAQLGTDAVRTEGVL
jgi:coproporphyrinogen III oxidase-like Fe-S oxidoreductase